MARPLKEGLDYFPLNVDIDQDDKVAIVEATHGVTGFAVVIKLLMKIYSEGYYYEWEEKQQILFSRRVNVCINEVNVIINDCVKWGLFNDKLFEEYSILTSAGIQRRFLEVTKRRKRVEIGKQHMLLHDNDVNVYNNIVYVDINSQGDVINDNINPQSKVKESKVKNSNTPLPPNKGIEGEISWKKDFEVYKNDLRKKYKELTKDKDWIEQQQSYYPNVDILKSLEKACLNYWSTEAGWANKKRKRTKSINWKTTLANALSLPANKVYKNNYQNAEKEPQTNIVDI